MSTGVGGTISATKNKLGEATINGKTRRVILFLNYIEKSVCSGAIFSRDSNNNTLDSIIISIAVSPPFFSHPISSSHPCPAMQAEYWAYYLFNTV